MNFTTRYPIAIDISDGTEMCALQLSSAGGIAVVRAAARRNVHAGDRGASADEDVRSFVHDVVHSRSFHGRTVAILLPADVVRSYPLRVEVGKAESLEAAVVRHAASDLNLSTEEWILDYASVGPDGPPGKGTRSVVLVAARNGDVSRYLRLVKQAGGELEVVDSAASALVRAHSLSAAGPNPVLLCNVGRSCTTLVVAVRDGILAQRNADWGTDRLSRKLADNLGLGGQTRDTAFLLRKHGLLPADAPDGAPGSSVATDGVAHTVGQLLAPLADELVHELHNIAGYVRAGASAVVMGGLFLYGHGAQVKGLAAYFARELNVEARSMNPLENIGTKKTQAISSMDDGAAYSLALGLAMRRVRWF